MIIKMNIIIKPDQKKKKEKKQNEKRASNYTEKSR